MARWKPHMTRSQRNRSNDTSRKYYLRKELERGRVPQPRKPAPWLLSLYKEFGVEDAVYIPQEWMSKEVLDEVKQEQKRIRARVRDMLPAEVSRKELEQAVKEVAIRRSIKKFKTA